MEDLGAASVADLLLAVPTAWVPLREAISSIDDGPRLAHAQLVRDFEKDPSTRLAYSPLGLYAGVASRLDEDELDQVPGYREEVALERDWRRWTYNKPTDQIPVTSSVRQPAGFEFYDSGERWECLIDAMWEVGWAPAEVPEFSGLLVGCWYAHAEKESRRLRLQYIDLGLVHKVDADLGPDLLIPQYAGLPFWQSVVRAELVSRLVERIDWPPEFSASLIDRLRTLLSKAHRPSSSSAEPQSGGDDTLTRDLAAHLGPYTAKVHSDTAEGSTASPTLPPPRLVKTAAAAERYAAEFMVACGFSDVAVTSPGADGGVDVWSAEAVAQVKMEGISTGRPVIQALHGIGQLERRACLVFSLAGFTADAVNWATRADVALFEFALDGAVVARSPLGMNLLRRGVLALS
jgi:hypothetical protein